MRRAATGSGCWPRSAASTRSPSSTRTPRTRCWTWLRPDVWVKGGDYATGAGELPEAELLAGWGGQTVVVPYLAGRSTTG